jgi:hypothetical protein
MDEAKLKRVTKIEYLGAPHYRVTFDDGVTGDVNFIDFFLLGSEYRPIEDATLFPQARVEAGEMRWPGGFTVCASDLYENTMWNRRQEKA